MGNLAARGLPDPEEDGRRLIAVEVVWAVKVTYDFTVTTTTGERLVAKAGDYLATHEGEGDLLVISANKIDRYQPMKVVSDGS